MDIVAVLKGTGTLLEKASLDSFVKTNKKSAATMEPSYSSYI